MVNLSQIKVREEDKKRIEDAKLSLYEPIYSVISRVLDKAETFDKRFKPKK